MKFYRKITVLLFIVLTACATSDSQISTSSQLASSDIAEDEIALPANAVENSVNVTSPERLSEARALIGNAESEFIEAALKVRAPVGGFLTDRGHVLTVVDDRFAVNATTLLTSAEKDIRNAVSFMAEHDNKVAVIEGHTDNTGSYAFNQRQSRGKAIAVRDALIEAGVDSERLSIRAVGGNDPIGDNETVAGRQLNRRVDIVFLK